MFCGGTPLRLMAERSFVLRRAEDVAGGALGMEKSLNRTHTGQSRGTVRPRRKKQRLPAFD
jgi:hypothetical protein